MSVSLDAKLEAIILRKVEVGLYPDTNEVVRQALRLPDEHDRLLQLRANLQVGLDQLERGEGRELNLERFEQIRQNAIRKDREGHQPNPDVCP